MYILRNYELVSWSAYIYPVYAFLVTALYCIFLCSHDVFATGPNKRNAILYIYSQEYNKCCIDLERINMHYYDFII